MVRKELAKTELLKNFGNRTFKDVQNQAGFPNTYNNKSGVFDLQFFLNTSKFVITLIDNE